MDIFVSPSVLGNPRNLTRVTDNVLNGFQSTLVYIDDIIVLLESLQEHTVNLKAVFQLIRRRCSFPSSYELAALSTIN